MATPEQQVWLSIAKIAILIGRSEAQTARLLAHLPAARRLRSRRRALYHQRVVDLLHGLLGQPYRDLSPSDADWLATYLREAPDARRTQPRPSTPGPPRPADR